MIHVVYTPHARGRSFAGTVQFASAHHSSPDLLHLDHCHSQTHWDTSVRKDICNLAQELTLKNTVQYKPAECPYPTGCSLPAKPWTHYDIAG